MPAQNHDRMSPARRRGLHLELQTGLYIFSSLCLYIRGIPFLTRRPLVRLQKRRDRPRALASIRQISAPSRRPSSSFDQESVEKSEVVHT
jgi:hypothetical protein